LSIGMSPDWTGCQSDGTVSLMMMFEIRQKIHLLFH
jgi:hypothetical protein